MFKRWTKIGNDCISSKAKKEHIHGNIATTFSIPPLPKRYDKNISTKSVEKTEITSDSMKNASITKIENKIIPDKLNRSETNKNKSSLDNEQSTSNTANDYEYDLIKYHEIIDILTNIIFNFTSNEYFLQAKDPSHGKSLVRLIQTDSISNCYNGNDNQDHLSKKLSVSKLSEKNNLNKWSLGIIDKKQRECNFSTMSLQAHIDVETTNREETFSFNEREKQNPDFINKEKHDSISNPRHNRHMKSSSDKKRRGSNKKRLMQKDKNTSKINTDIQRTQKKHEPKNKTDSPKDKKIETWYKGMQKNIDKKQIKIGIQREYPYRIYFISIHFHCPFQIIITIITKQFRLIEK